MVGERARDRGGCWGRGAGTGLLRAWRARGRVGETETVLQGRGACWGCGMSRVGAAPRVLDGVARVGVAARRGLGPRRPRLQRGGSDPGRSPRLQHGEFRGPDTGGRLWLQATLVPRWVIVYAPASNSKEPSHSRRVLLLGGELPPFRSILEERFVCQLRRPQDS